MSMIWIDARHMAIKKYSATASGAKATVRVEIEVSEPGALGYFLKELGEAKAEVERERKAATAERGAKAERAAGAERIGHQPRLALPSTQTAAERKAENDAFWEGVGDVFATGLKLKKIMLDRGLRRCRCACPRCGGWIQAGLVGRKNHLRMACEGRCGMNMME